VSGAPVGVQLGCCTAENRGQGGESDAVVLLGSAA